MLEKLISSIYGFLKEKNLIINTKKEKLHHKTWSFILQKDSIKI